MDKHTLNGLSAARNEFIAAYVDSVYLHRDGKMTPTEVTEVRRDAEKVWRERVRS